MKVLGPAGSFDWTSSLTPRGPAPTLTSAVKSAVLPAGTDCGYETLVQEQLESTFSIFKSRAPRFLIEILTEFWPSGRSPSSTNEVTSSDGGGHTADAIDDD